MPNFLKSYKAELKPNNKQKTALRQHTGAARWAYNWALDKKKKMFDNKEKILGKMDG